MRTAKTGVAILICFFIYSFIVLVSLFLWFKFEVIKDTLKKLICIFGKKAFVPHRKLVLGRAAAPRAPAMPGVHSLLCQPEGRVPWGQRLPPARATPSAFVRNVKAFLPLLLKTCISFPPKGNK